MSYLLSLTMLLEGRPVHYVLFSLPLSLLKKILKWVLLCILWSILIPDNVAFYCFIWKREKTWSWVHRKIFCTCSQVISFSLFTDIWVVPKRQSKWLSVLADLPEDTIQFLVPTGYLTTLMLIKQWHKEDSNRHVNVVDEVSESQEISNLHKDTPGL